MSEKLCERGCSHSKVRDNESLWIKTVSPPPNYMPKIMPVKQSYWHELCNYFVFVCKVIALGIGLGALMAIFIVIKFDLLG